MEINSKHLKHFSVNVIVKLAYVLNRGFDLETIPDCDASDEFIYYFNLITDLLLKYDIPIKSFDDINLDTVNCVYYDVKIYKRNIDNYKDLIFDGELFWFSRELAIGKTKNDFISEKIFLEKLLKIFKGPYICESI